MGEITLEQCIKREEAQSEKFYTALETVRAETKRDIELIRGAVQDIDRSVSRILGWAGLTGGSGQGSVTHPHHREGEEADRLHQRMVDAISAAELAASAATKATAAVVANAETAKTAVGHDGLTLPRWAVIGLAGFVLLMIALLVSEERYSRMKKAPISSSLVTK